MDVSKNAVDKTEHSEKAPATCKGYQRLLELDLDKARTITTKSSADITRHLAWYAANSNEISNWVRYASRKNNLPWMVGNIWDNFEHSKSQSIFGSLVPENQLLDALTAEILEKRAEIQAGRITPKQLPHKCHCPYKTVKNQKLKLRLLQIAQVTQFLDRGFAEYFQVAVLCLGKENVCKLLDHARKTIAKMQNRQEDPSSADVGDLGNFCEQTASTFDDPDKRNPRFTVTLQRDQEILHYLQDALEVPYWNLMVDIFLRWKANSASLSGNVVIRVLHSAKLELLDGKRRLLDELSLLQGEDAENITPIVHGIDERIEVLNSIWDNTLSNLDGTHCLLVSFLEQPSQPPSVAPKQPAVSLQEEQMGRQMETATLIALVILFIIAAIIPGSKAIAISLQDSAVGSIRDADFWYLVQSSIMAVMGNIIMVVPMLNKSWFSPAYRLMWGFFALGLVFAIISVAIYPLLNPGWSSMVAFISSIASVASVLIMTQANKGGSRVKSKQD